MGNRKPPVKKFIDDVQAEVKKGVIKPVNPLQLLLNIISLCVFPFVARPMFQLVTNIDRAMFDKILEQRKGEVSKFIIDAIKNSLITKRWLLPLMVFPNLVSAQTVDRLTLPQTYDLAHKELPGHKNKRSW